MRLAQGLWPHAALGSGAPHYSLPLGPLELEK